MIHSIVEKALSLRGICLAAMIAVMVYGAWCYKTAPRDAFPDISPVMVPVFAEAPGLAPEEIERLITIPLESVMSGLPDVMLVKSTSAFGMAVVYVYFEDRADIYFSRQLVAERLAAAVSTLPANLPPPELGPISSGLGQIFIYYLEADPGIDTDGKELLTYLRDLNDVVVKRQLQTVPGVTTVLSMGGHVLQYQIELDPDRMRQYDIAVDDVINAVVDNNRNVGGQYVVIGAEEYLVRGIGLLESLDDIADIALRENRGARLLLRDIATVKYGSEVRRGIVSLNGEGEVVAGMVLKLYGENTSEVIAGLHRKLDEIASGLPAGVRIVPSYDQADLVENASRTVESALLQGIALVVVLLALALWNLRAALIVTLSMPFCAALAMIGMRHLGATANLMSLGGIAIALGMLVDGSIVVTENILRHLRLPENAGLSRDKIIRKATLEVGRPIAFALLIVCAVFLPLFALEGVEGKLFRPLAVSVIIALLGSILAAVVNAPVLASFLLRKQPADSRENQPGWVARRGYAPLVRQAIRWRFAIFAAVLLAVVASIFGLRAIGREFMPTLEEGSLLISVGMAPSIGLDEAVRVVQRLERRILEHPQAVSTVARIGRPEAGSHPHPVNFAEIQVELRAPGKGSLGAEARQAIVAELRRELQFYPGININYSQPIQNSFEELLSGIRAYFAIKLYGDDFEVLRVKAEEIRHAVAEVDGVVDLSVEQNFGQPQIRIVLDREKAARYGVSGSEVMQLVESAVGGETVSSIFSGSQRYDISLRLAEEFRGDPDALRELRLRAANGRTVALQEIADIMLTEGPIQIQREKNQRRWTVQGNISGRAPSYIVADMKRVIAEQVELPPGYFVEFGGQFENQERAMLRLSLIVPVVILIIFLILWWVFGSLRNAVMVMFNVPLCLIGGIAGLLITGQLLSVPAAVGFIALFGIALQDAVVMVSDFRDLREGGASLWDAVVTGSLIRFRAVMLTTLTTLLGLLPLLLSRNIGAEIQRPLAAIVVYGLAGSTLLTLFVLPGLYYEVERHFKWRPGTDRPGEEE